MAASADLHRDLLLATICDTSSDGEDTNFTTLLDAVGRLRHSLLNASTNDPTTVSVPDVLRNDVIFKSVFCFLLGAHRAVGYLEELGRTAVEGWSTLVQTEPLEFITNMVVINVFLKILKTKFFLETRL